jgi:hypothetical protein
MVSIPERLWGDRHDYSDADLRSVVGQTARAERHVGASQWRRVSLGDRQDGTGGFLPPIATSPHLA